MSDTQITVALPSLLHRLERAQVGMAKQLSLEHDCTLKRVRRSRNWQLIGTAPSIDAFLNAFKSSSASERCFLCTKIEAVLCQHQDKLEPFEDKLVRLLKATPEMTLNELMAQTQCTMTQARQARFSVEEEW
ncbi:ribosome recycling factor [Vibrio astriarenae]|uniref:Ribosome recycling factor n=1 Tax=Vibrio astriarenae TaxID=1481923 RepID=A0A7Z2YEY0_9VIBR|nr:ribosome recycling factor family protein [Vibrio astriarenae]QIA64786.1 ribosome recycling factor [Vibrio astriarenae]